MADFCTKCAKEMGFLEPDINVEEIFENLEDGYSQSGFICERCGLIMIAKIEGELQVMRIKDDETHSEYEQY